jgi:hypothetical protein
MEYTNRRNANEYGLFALMGVVHPTDSVVRNENTGNGCGMCLEAHDLAAAKLVAGREKDLSFVAAMLQHNVAKAPTVESRLLQTPLPDEHLKLALARLKRITPR